jgi:hypothetical protein
MYFLSLCSALLVSSVVTDSIEEGCSECTITLGISNSNDRLFIIIIVAQNKNFHYLFKFYRLSFKFVAID